jgi:parvulin-like peptidyl-prolyl isomerase
MKRVIFLFLIIFIFANVSFAKLEFKELDNDDVVAYINGHKISLEDIDTVKVDAAEHLKDSRHGFKKPSLGTSILLRAMMDKYLVFEAATLLCKGTIEYDRALRSVKETLTLNKFLEEEVVSKIKEEDKAERKKKISEAIEKIPEENRADFKIQINSELIDDEKLINSGNNKLVLAKVDDYEIMLYDVLNKSSASYYIQKSPGMISKDTLRESLDSLVKRAIILNTAMKLGYGEEGKLSEGEERNIVINVANAIEYKNLDVSEEDIKKAYEDNRALYEKTIESKYGAILKKDKTALEEIKERIDKGEDFFEIAKAETEDEKSRENSGLFDYSNKDSGIVKNKLLKMKNGEVSDVFKFKKTHMIIKRIDVRYDELEEIRHIIDNDIRQELLKRSREEKMPKLRERADIIINTKIISEEAFLGASKKAEPTKE